MKVFEIKQRPLSHPLIVHVAQDFPTERYAQISSHWVKDLTEAFWPGPLTVILPRVSGGVTPEAVNSQDSLALRCPSHPVAQELLERFGRGIAAPSANQHKGVSPTRVEHVRQEFGDDFPVLDGGGSEIGIESTIVDGRFDQPVLIRPGAIGPSQITEATGLDIRREPVRTVAAPGTLSVHYQPKARVAIFKESSELRTILSQTNPGQLAAVLTARGSLSPEVRDQLNVLATPADSQEFAAGLYHWFRQADEQGAELLVIQEPDDDELGQAIMDRLLRAASQ